MKKIILLVVLLAAVALNAEELKSLRGEHPLDSVPPPPEKKIWAKDGETIPRNYVQQPPLIPHKITGYQINLKYNKCLSCHGWKHYKESGATKISLTHFKDREGNELSDVSPRRYFCTQCHVPQANAKPLVENTFKPVDSIKE